MIFIRHWLQLLAASALWSSAVVCLGSAFRDLLGIASALVLSSEVQDTVGVNLESHLSGVHRGVLRQLLLVLPLEELDAIFRILLATEVAVGCGLLVIWLAQCQGKP